MPKILPNKGHKQTKQTYAAGNTSQKAKHNKAARQPQKKRGNSEIASNSAKKDHSTQKEK